VQIHHPKYWSVIIVPVPITARRQRMSNVMEPGNSRFQFIVA
jgi:hypothetical protein